MNKISAVKHFKMHLSSILCQKCPGRRGPTKTRASVKKGGHSGTRLKMIGDGSLGKTLSRELRRIIAQDARKMTKLKEVRSLEWRIYRPC